MKQKILYILMMIAALFGREEMVFGQAGYVLKSTNVQYSADVKTLDSNLSNGRITLANSTKINNTTFTSTFTIGDNLNGKSGDGIELKIGSGKRTNTINYSLSDPTIYNVAFKLTGFELSMHSTSKIDIKISPSSGTSKTWTLPNGITPVSNSFTAEELNSSQSISISLESGTTWAGPWAYLRSVKFTYTLSYYELDISSLESAITTANKALGSITDETMKSYLNAAIENANSFKAECAFPKSYWNGSSVGKIPAEVTTTAEKLNAITNYLIARTNANQFEQSKVPNAVYDWLHTYDQYNPNDFDTNTINTATNDINAAISAANATTSAYQSALTTIASAENSFDKTNDQETLTADIVKAKEQLEQAKNVEEINSALANIKSFDTITFNAESEIEEGNTLANPASAQSSKVITYSSSDNTIIEIDGTTLKALKPGTVTITATTTTGNGYYGYATTKEFTVTPKAVILNPVNECTVVPNVVYPEITLNRTFVVGHSTLALPFDTNISDFSDDSEAYAAQLSLVTYNKADGYTLYFKKADAGSMTANQPYVIYLPSIKDSFTWTDVTINSVVPSDKVEGQGERFMGWTMRANYTPGVSMEGMYGIAEGKLRKGTAGATINAYTAYFMPPTQAEARVRVAILDDSGQTTFINEIGAESLDMEQEVYAVDGKRVSGLQKGINIVRMKDGSVRKIWK